MATLVLTVVGGIVGGPVGAAVGAAIGQQVDAAIDPGLHRAQCREVVAALDAVVAVQMLEESLQRGHEGGVQAARVELARAPVCSGVGHMPLLGAKTRVHLQPEGGGFGHGAGPALTREGVAQIEHVGGQARAKGQRELVDRLIRRQRWCSG